jgi:D-beta-D-heptose 7-phosphate kinase/D-beta-D-heptose 1-phosphate adenosyltransferase
MIKGAQNFGRVLIILNSDSWLMKKKGLVMMPWHERKEILLAIKGIDFVESVDDHDGTVCEALKRLKPNIFGNGGIRGQKNTPERQLCNELGIACVWGIGGGEQDVYSNDILEKIYSAKRPNI